MTDTVRTRTVAAGPQEVWDLLADFGAISGWAGNVDHSCILWPGADGGAIGTSRRIQAGRTVVVERIVEFEPGRALAYDIEGLPQRLKRVRNRWSLEPGDGKGTLVTLTSTVEIGPRPPQQLAERIVCRVLARKSDAMLAGISEHLDNPNTEHRHG